MKCKVSATDLKNLIKSMEALKTLGVNTKEEDIRCCFTVRNDHLWVEGANMGAYIRRKLPVVTMRDGACGVNLKDLVKSRFVGDVILDFDLENRRLRIACRKSRFNIPVDQSALSVIESSRPVKNQVDVKAVVPASVIIEGTSMVAIKPGLKEEDLKMQFCITQTEKGGQIEIIGLDHFSFARYVKVQPDIKVKAPMKFVLRSSSPSIVMREITANVVGIGTEEHDGSTSLVRFASDDADVYYPALDTEYLDAEAQAADIRSGVLDCGFIAFRKQLRDAVNTVKPVQDSAATGVLILKISEKAAEIAARSSGGLSGSTIIATNAIKVRGSNPQLIQVSEKYFFEILTLAPEVLPLRVESWDKRFLAIKVTKVEDGLIEFFMSQMDLPEDAEQKNKKAS